MNKTILITGASSGIGKATAIKFASEGCNLILCGRRKEILDQLASELKEQFKVNIYCLTFDIQNYNECEDSLQSLPAEFSKIDVLINNAGLALGLDYIHEGSLDHWNTMIDTNIKGLLYMTKIISKNMVQNKSGQIINICSTAGKETYPKGNVYSATKFAVDALTKSIRQDLFQHNIRVSQISPGHVENTEFAINRFEGDTIKANIYSDFNPLTSADVADSIFFIYSRPEHVTIHDLIITGTQQASSSLVDRSGRRFDK
ncbi:MAG: SDR family NAD(P)-dependent oxidoreductase [Saprospiraceae bacterium]